jgi:hypothetical protein
MIPTVGTNNTSVPVLCGGATFAAGKCICPSGFGGNSCQDVSILESTFFMVHILIFCVLFVVTCGWALLNCAAACRLRKLAAKGTFTEIPTILLFLIIAAGSLGTVSATSRKPPRPLFLREIPLFGLTCSFIQLGFSSYQSIRMDLNRLFRNVCPDLTAAEREITLPLTPSCSFNRFFVVHSVGETILEGVLIWSLYGSGVLVIVVWYVSGTHSCATLRALARGPRPRPRFEIPF